MAGPTRNLLTTIYLYRLYTLRPVCYLIGGCFHNDLFSQKLEEHYDAIMLVCGALFGAGEGLSIAYAESSASPELRGG